MNLPIQILIDENGFVVMSFYGDLTDEMMPAFKSALAVSSMSIIHHSTTSGKKIKVLLNMRNFSGKYSVEALDTLANFAKNNVEYIDKTASFGGSESVRMTGEIVSHMAHRDNIKVFATKEEAVAWLKN
jgi:hypothetical protein